MADNHVVYKNGAKEIAHLNGCSITFMAKPDHTWIGSSCHIHSSLWRDGERRVRRRERRFRQYLAGQIACARELAIFFAPNMNSYKRYAAGSWAPTTLAWGLTTGRAASGCRLGRGAARGDADPGRRRQPVSRFAATIAAGLYGIENDARAAARARGNAYESDVERFPSTLREAIAALERGSMARGGARRRRRRHYLNYARREQGCSTSVVTDWSGSGCTTWLSPAGRRDHDVPDAGSWGAWNLDAALVPADYVRAVCAAGGAPLLVPPGACVAGDARSGRRAHLLRRLRLDPELYGAQAHPETDGSIRERDDFELELMRAALERDMPMLAICRGRRC